MMKVNRADESQSCLRICKMTIDMVREVSDLHMNAFKGSMNTRLGNVYLQRFFDWFVRLEHGISLVGILKTAETEQIVGYVVGAPLDYGKALNRDLFWVAAWNTVIRPWLFLNRQFRENVSARIGSFGKTSKVPSFQVELPAPAMSLVGLAILPSFQEKVLGRKCSEHLKIKLVPCKLDLYDCPYSQKTLRRVVHTKNVDGYLMKVCQIQAKLCITIRFCLKKRISFWIPRAGLN